ncbi:MAG TPA: hypothetical protein VHY22_00235 [Chthoniobacteraceae bacterium]|jgi:hypothetical protein|nr:hypothetical protein [Chthoniobacteraceae bacterium]
MNCLPRLSLLMLLAVLASLFPVRGAVLDNFDEYTQTSGTGTYIQGSSNQLATAQQGTNGKWLRFGSAVSDGLYSSSGAKNGSTGRGVVADASFSAGTATTYIPEFYFTTTTGSATTYDLSDSGSCTITLDIKVTTATILPNLDAYIQIQDASGEQYQSAAVSLASDSSYTTYSFVFALGQVTVSQFGSPADSLATVLAQATQLNIVFKDTTDTGAQAIDFDNLVDLPAVPEPRSTALSLVGGGIALLLMRPRRRRTPPAA